MNRDQFSAALDRHGGDLARWPAALRREAEALVERDTDAARELAAARRLDALLAEAITEAPADAALIGRIVSRSEPPTRQALWRPTGRLVGIASAAMAVMLMIGFIAGATVPDPSNDVFAGLLFSDTDDSGGGDFL